MAPGESTVKDQPGWARSVHQRKLQDYREVRMLGIEWDREQLERGEARVLANNFKNKEWLEMALKKSERIYGRGAGERIKAHMRMVWKLEMCK